MITKVAKARKQALTGNVTGVYDMSGGTWEYIAAYIDNGARELTTYGSTLIDVEQKYKDVYNIGDDDSKDNNYIVTTPENGHYGDAIYEVSSKEDEINVWYDDYSNYPHTSWPFFLRGGNSNSHIKSGIFSSSCNDGSGSYTSLGFRIALAVF